MMQAPLGESRRANRFLVLFGEWVSLLIMKIIEERNTKIGTNQATTGWSLDGERERGERIVDLPKTTQEIELAANHPVGKRLLNGPLEPKEAIPPHHPPSPIFSPSLSSSL